ncbi:hypothetical protein ASG56_11335 [Rhodococcus sp. Leaf7]|uniref:linalool dehydratase/isomerase domain-containing protein n=1 Tax=unclassified Rhodococcus (in: high G+C Gram-positive bacteria) TaxID=192944 RepID=UPI0006FE942D|nr:MULTISPECIES: hypothetical protein [unclassified Rhodococcus (in: high G+C Gram-positive bacteria)]KQU04012.1 hypothetical protein ASG56_11335 [Rhodococcus sp. Leaf7]KQU40196.1 hypothetical protein ASG64_11330 [Rhodococcus sp. Leaf247]
MSVSSPTRLGRIRPARLLPSSRPVLPPATASRLRRTAYVYSGILVVAVVVAATSHGPLRLAAIGAFWPGAGHLAAGHPVHALITLAAFAVSLLVWWMVGAAVAPIAVYVLSIVSTAALHEGHHHAAIVGPALVVPGAVLIAGAIHLVRHRRQMSTAYRLNDELESVTWFETALPSTSEPDVRTASEADLAHLRLALDLGLQPLENFDGFDHRDQFREAALRYQLSILGYALSMYRYTHTPAFSGYLAEAQRNAVVKMGDRRVWGYWPLENAWGRFSVGRDPVRNRDNVMLTGWQGAAVGMYESFGDDRFSRPGGLSYVWSDDVRYDHDFPALAASIHRNMTASPFTLFSCEPRWIYPVCNAFGVITMQLSDRLHGTEYVADLQDDIHRSYEMEFQRPDGRSIGVRNETLGMSWNIWAGQGVTLPTTYWLGAFAPDLSHRSWWLTRRDALTHDGHHYRLPRSAATRCDAGDYSFGSDAFAHVFLALTAREVGDIEVADDALDYVDSVGRRSDQDGVARYEGLSTQGNLYALMARFSRPAANRDLVGAGLPTQWLTGPQLAEAPYPDVLVARAVSDGRDLDLVLFPGATGSRVTLVVDRLVPRRTYRVRGAVTEAVQSDDDGRARVQVDLAGRTAVRLDPTW